MVLLKRHILGEDLLLLEREFNKASEDYDSGANISRLGRLKMQFGRMADGRMG